MPRIENGFQYRRLSIQIQFISGLAKASRGEGKTRNEQEIQVLQELQAWQTVQEMPSAVNDKAFSAATLKA